MPNRPLIGCEDQNVKQRTLVTLAQGETRSTTRVKKKGKQSAGTSLNRKTTPINHARTHSTEQSLATTREELTNAKKRGKNQSVGTDQIRPVDRSHSIEPQTQKK